MGNPSKNNMAVAGFVLGLVGLIAWLLPILGLVVGILAIVFSAQGMSSMKRGMAVAGLILAIIGIILTLINGALGAYMGATGKNPLEAFFPEQKEVPKQELIDQTVKEAKASESFPIELDEYTIFTNITAEDGAIRYHYEIRGVDASKISNDLLKANTLKELCSDEGIKYLLGKDINLQYQYMVKGTKQEFMFEVGRKDCSI